MLNKERIEWRGASWLLVEPQTLGLVVFVTLAVLSTVVCAQNIMATSISRPVKRHVAIVGDSYAQQLGGGESLVSAKLGAANIALLNVLANQPWYVDPILDNFGVGGGTDADIISELPAIIKRHPDMLFIQGGHNDFIRFGATRFCTMVNEWRLVISKLLAVGIQPVLILDPPINSSEGSTQVTLQQLRSLDNAFNQWKRAYAQRLGLLVWNWYDVEVDPTDPNGAWKATFTDDGIHPNFAGNMAIARSALQELSSILGHPMGPASLISSQSDSYDPSYNQFGNLLTSAFFMGAGGSTSGGFRGTAPTGFSTNSILAASRKVLKSSLVPSDDHRGEWWQLAVSGNGVGGSDSEIIWGQNQGSAGAALPAGTVVEGWVQVRVLGNSPFNSCMGKLAAGANVALGNASVSPGFQNGAGPTEEWEGTIYIPPLLIPSTGYSGLNLYLQCQYNDVSNNFSGIVQWRRPTVRVVPK